MASKIPLTSLSRFRGPPLVSLRVQPGLDVNEAIERTLFNEGVL